jgi:hypothetical protein
VCVKFELENLKDGNHFEGVGIDWRNKIEKFTGLDWIKLAELLVFLNAVMNCPVL